MFVALFMSSSDKNLNLQIKILFQIVVINLTNFFTLFHNLLHNIRKFKLNGIFKILKNRVDLRVLVFNPIISNLLKHCKHTFLFYFSLIFNPSENLCENYHEFGELLINLIGKLCLNPTQILYQCIVIGIRLTFVLLYYKICIYH